MLDVIEAWLDLPAAGVLVCLAALYGTTAAALVWASYGSLLGARVRRVEGVVAPFFGAIGILFALLTGFLAGDIGERNRQAARAVSAEAAELRNVFTLSVAAVSEMREMRAAWSVYVKAVIGDEWRSMADGNSAPSVDAAYDALLREAADPKKAAESGAAAHSALLNAAVRVGTARSERLALAADNTSELKWSIVLILGVMTQIAIGVVHLQKRHAQIAALAIFSVSVVIALGLIAMQEHPFAGEVRISAWPLQELLKLQAP